MGRVQAAPEAIRRRLVDAGVDLVEREGVQALSVRKLAAEVGTSTMAVYTHFGGMTGLLDAIANEVFARFTRALTDIPETDDPVADFLSMGLAYRAYALANPERYQLMFGTSAPASIAVFRSDVTVTGRAAQHGREDWGMSFQALVDVVRRMMAAGRIRDDDVLAVAGRFWSVNHGSTLLETVGFFGRDDHGVTHILGPLITDVLVGMGDDPERVAQSLSSALKRSA
jgi:AcrR family transcriptional regulator